jgi:hypothetical protein
MCYSTVTPTHCRPHSLTYIDLVLLYYTHTHTFTHFRLVLLYFSLTHSLTHSLSMATSEEEEQYRQLPRGVPTLTYARLLDPAPVDHSAGTGALTHSYLLHYIMTTQHHYHTTSLHHYLTHSHTSTLRVYTEVHSLTHSLHHLLHHSLLHCLTHSQVQVLTHSLTHSLFVSFTHCLTNYPTHSLSL